MGVLRMVGRRPAYVALGCLSFAGLALFYLWSSQVLSVGADGVSVLVEPWFIVAALLMSALFGMLVPLQIFSFRRVTTLATEAGGTAFGAVVGATSMTCCAPVLLPSILSLLGFSGVTILGVNATLGRFWLPLATLSVILLTAVLVSTIRSLGRACNMDSRPGIAPR
jgi:hypothetical protein